MTVTEQRTLFDGAGTWNLGGAGTPSEQSGGLATAAYDHLASRSSGAGAEPATIDLFNADEVATAVADGDAVIHL